ncbi:helix-turn-helix domain-containing protein [Bacillus thuringiensis]|uniref:helix-turn-helix domain-containing protein n=1 Tax=Bacillus thuringiensis TaxID=1428 RepID=UPI0021D6925A|nr:helix-turn-helix domain-containing protein [Bacillus thuringiensis]MCU7667616.1 helix-turn-helix domain-containing protein [Bacillus thuringiensis]
MGEERTRFDTREDVRKFIEEEVLTSTEAAEVLGVSRARVSQLIGEGKLVPVKKLRGDSLFYRKDVLEKLEELKEKRAKYRPYDSQ